MFLRILAALPLLFALPEFRINWKDSRHDALNVSISGYNETVERCIESGLEVRYRYELQLCRRRTLWFHACKERNVVLQSLQFDPISEMYKVTRDRLGDDRGAVRTSAGTFEEGLAAASNVSDLPLGFLSGGDQAFVSDPRLYVSARVLATCRGEYNETLARIGYFLTLGLVKVSAFNTGRIDFNLDGEGRK